MKLGSAYLNYIRKVKDTPSVKRNAMQMPYVHAVMRQRNATDVIGRNSIDQKPIGSSTYDGIASPGKRGPKAKTDRYID